MTQLKILPTYDPTLFESASEVYAQYRTKYSPAVFDKLTMERELVLERLYELQRR